MTNYTMLSRVADNLYWMSRYLERAEHTSRLIDVHLNLMLDMASASVEQQRLRRLHDSLSLPAIRFATEGDELLRRLTFDSLNPMSIVSTIASARENARQVREHLSSEMWMQINKLYLHVRRADANVIWRESPHDFYLEVREGSHLFQGITDATMNHNQGWHFIQIGRYIERIFALLQLLDVHFHNVDIQRRTDITAESLFDWVMTLKSVTAYEAYCKVYNPNLQPVWMLEFLLFNKEFPRSLRFCVEMIQFSLNAIADATMRNRNARLYRIAGKLQSSLNYDDIADIQDLHHYLEQIKQQIYAIHDTLYDTYISYQIETAF
jgi:uncharacterized alpha-E superfamily protein